MNEHDYFEFLKNANPELFLFKLKMKKPEISDE